MKKHLWQFCWLNPIVSAIGLLITWILSTRIVAYTLFYIRPITFGNPFSTPIGFETTRAFTAGILLWVLVVRLEKQSFASIGLIQRGAVSEIIAGFLLGAFAYSLYMGVVWFGGWYRIHGYEHNFSILANLWVSFLVSFSEEAIFRGYIFRRFEQRWSTRAALLLSTLLFGLAHVPMWQTIHPIEGIVKPIIGASALGFLFTTAYLLKRRLWMPIGLHWAWDAGALLFFYSYGVRTLYRYIIYNPAFTISGLAFWTSCLICLILGFCLLRTSGKHRNT